MVVFFSCSDQDKQNNGGSPVIKFYQNEFDFGFIQMGEKVTHDFLFINTGDGDLYINKVVSDCGCTIANYKEMQLDQGNNLPLKLYLIVTGYQVFN